MITEDWLNDEPPKPKSKKKSKGAAAHVQEEPIDDTFDAMLESASQTANLATSKQKLAQRSPFEATGGWSNDMNDDNDDYDNAGIPNAPPLVRRTSHRPAEEIIAADIPTIPMDDADDDNPIDMTPQVAVAPEFSVHQIASFKDMEKEFSRERASQYIDPKIDIGILYHNLHLQEEFDAEDQKQWDWDKLFVEVRNCITNQ